MSAPAAGSSAAATGSGSKRPFPGAAADSERRVQPRHFHAGPNPAGASASGAAAAAEAAGPGPSPAARLYRHALESIFTFLTQRELAKALQVSSSWLAAVESMASLQLTIKKTSAPLRVIADSAIGRHVTQLGDDYQRESVPLTADSLFIVARLMPQLRKLRCDLELTPTQGPLTFPPALQTLRLPFTGELAAADVNAALKTISRLPLLEVLFLRLPSFNNQFSFAAPASLAQLRDLFIHASRDSDDADVAHDIELSNAQVAELRALPRLRQLDLQPLPTPLLRRLLAQPHDLQWQEICLPSLSDQVAALLPQLPSLTKLAVSRITTTRFDFLQRLPNLIDLSHYAPQRGGALESLVAGLQCCNRLESLLLSFRDLTAAHLAALLPRLPRLHALTLRGVDVTTLSFLAQPPMTSQLTYLWLWGCELLPLTELRHVHALKSLKTLRLDDSFDSFMDEHCEFLYTPPSLLLPRLEQFSYSP